MKYWFVQAETRDGENEYSHEGVLEAETLELATDDAFRLFSYSYCPEDCSGRVEEGEESEVYETGDCIYHDGEYRITTVTGVSKIPRSDYEVLRRYL